MIFHLKKRRAKKVEADEQDYHQHESHNRKMMKTATPKMTTRTTREDWKEERGDKKRMGER